MATFYKANDTVVKVPVGSPSGNRVARIIPAGGLIPEGVDQAHLDKLAKLGLIKKVTVADAKAPVNPVDELKAKLAEAQAEAAAANAEKEKAQAEAKDANDKLEAATKAAQDKPAPKTAGTK